jgi:tetratricopeptide (TPR) repeat protein
MDGLWAYGPSAEYLKFGYEQLKNVALGFSSWLDSLTVAHDWLIEKLSKLIAPVVTILTGSYAIYQRWYYAENKLRLRLSQFLARENKRLAIAYEALDKRIERPSPAREFKAPIFSRWGLKPAFYASGIGSPSPLTYFLDRVDRAEVEVGHELKQLQSQLDLWDEVKSDYQSRKARAHVCRAAIFACKAAMARNQERDERPYNLSALNDFEEALRLNPDNLLAMELAAHMRVRLGEYSRAIQGFSELAERAAQRGDKLTAMRAFKFAGEVHLYKNNPSYLGASAALNSAFGYLPEGSHPLELAELHELQGIARENMNNALAAALGSFEDAERYYADASGPEAIEGRGRARDAKLRVELRMN